MAPIAGWAKLVRQWQNLGVSRWRMKHPTAKWLKWESDAVDEEGEASGKALVFNCEIIRCMVQCLKTLDPLPIKKLMRYAPQP